jgi:hypothetical protein
MTEPTPAGEQPTDAGQDVPQDGGDTGPTSPGGEGTPGVETDTTGPTSG